jgi:hypothetical protein
MPSKAYGEMIAALHEAGIGIVHESYSWRTFGSWVIVVNTTPRRKIVWNGRHAQLKILHTIDGDPDAFWHYRLHWEGPEGYSPRTEAVIDALLRDDSPQKNAYDEAVLEREKACHGSSKRRFAGHEGRPEARLGIRRHPREPHVARAPPWTAHPQDDIYRATNGSAR